MTSRSSLDRSNTSVASMSKSGIQTPRAFSSSASQSSNGASSPRRGRGRMPVVIMSSQIPRLSDNRLHPYSQLSQSPVSPTLLAKDARSGTGPARHANRSRLANSDKPTPVIRPQVDRYPTDELPSPLLLPPQRTSTVETLQPLGQREVNRQRPRSSRQDMKVDLSGLNNKLGFHVPARETITPRGSDDESEDLLSFGARRGRRSLERDGKRNSRSLCIEEKARGRSKQEEATTRGPLGNAVSALPASRDTGVTSPSERRGRSREVKPCSQSPKSLVLVRLAIPSATVQEFDEVTDAMASEDDIGTNETTTVEEILSNHSPARATALNRPGGRVRSPASPRVTSTSILSPDSTRSTGTARQPTGERPPSSQGPTPSSVVDSAAGPLSAGTSHKATKDKSTVCGTPTSLTPTLVPPKPVRALSEKSCPTVMKHTGNVFAPASPVTSTVELADVDSSVVSSASSLQMPRRTASISLKRIQDQDLETIMGSSTIKVPSPITSRFSLPYQESDSLHYQESEPVEQGHANAARHLTDHGPLHWLREVVPKSKEALPKARTLLKLASPKSPRPVRAVSHHIATGSSDSHDPEEGSSSFGRAVLKRSRTASTATERGDQKRHYTRWDGVQTEITEEDHPVHWAILQRRHELRKQGSKQSLKYALLPRAHSPMSSRKGAKHSTISPKHSQPASPTSHGPTTPSRVVSLGSLAHQAVSSLTRPISHRHMSAPLRVPSSKSTGNIHQELLGDNLRSSVSYEVLSAANGLKSLSSSFDSKVAYKACKKEEGYVDFDKVLGLDNHEAVHEQVVGVVAD